jgi:hypothetical protein
VHKKLTTTEPTRKQKKLSLAGNPIKKFETITKMTGRVMLALGDLANKKKLKKEINKQVLAVATTMMMIIYMRMLLVSLLGG